MDALLALVVLALVGRAILHSTTSLVAWKDVVYRRVRALAAAAGVVTCFVVYLAHRGDFGESLGAGLVTTAVAALLLAALLPPALFVCVHVVAPPLRWLGDVWGLVTRTRQRRRAERAARRERDRHEGAAPDRAKADKERATDQRRRADARAACEIFYSLHAPEIGPRFAKDEFATFVARHLGDEHPPEYVERRAEQLLALLKQHLRKVLPPLGTETLDEILAAFDDRIRRVRASTLDDRDQEVVLLQLEQEREDAIRRALREGRL